MLRADTRSGSSSTRLLVLGLSSLFRLGLNVLGVSSIQLTGRSWCHFLLYHKIWRIPRNIFNLKLSFTVDWSRISCWLIQYTREHPLLLNCFWCKTGITISSIWSSIICGYLNTWPWWWLFLTQIIGLTHTIVIHWWTFKSMSFYLTYITHFYFSDWFKVTHTSARTVFWQELFELVRRTHL